MEIQNRLTQINNGVISSRFWDMIRERAPGVIGGGITGFLSVPGAVGGVFLGMRRMQPAVTGDIHCNNFFQKFHPTTLGSWGGGFLASGLAVCVSYQNLESPMIAPTLGNLETLVSALGPEYTKAWVVGVAAGTLLSAAAEFAYRQRREHLAALHRRGDVERGRILSLKPTNV